MYFSLMLLAATSSYMAYSEAEASLLLQAESPEGQQEEVRRTTRQSAAKVSAGQALASGGAAPADTAGDKRQSEGSIAVSLLLCFLVRVFVQVLRTHRMFDVRPRRWTRAQ